MLTTLLTALGSKIAVGVAAGTLAAGTLAAAAVGVPAALSDDRHEVELIDHDVTDAPDAGDGADVEVFEEIVDTGIVDDDTGGGDDADGGHGQEHPDNFGAVVSDDARDGGVDGREISHMARERNEERRESRRHGAGADRSDASADNADDADDADVDDGVGASPEDVEERNEREPDPAEDVEDRNEREPDPADDRNGDAPGRGHGRGGPSGRGDS